MRVYFEKPRTTIGWKGLINDPHLDGSGDVNTGLRMARELLLEVLGLGLPVGCEFLDPITPQYISDTVSWGAIGARTTESQIHRQLGSGLSMPVGFKNRTDGNVQVAVDAVARRPSTHAFAGVDTDGKPAILHTRGNPDGHVILRGGSGRPTTPRRRWPAHSRSCDGGPARARGDRRLARQQRQGPRAPARRGGRRGRPGGGRQHGDRGHDARVVPGRRAAGPGLRGELTFGQSITDACMDWDTTVEVLDGLAGACARAAPRFREDRRPRRRASSEGRSAWPRASAPATPRWWDSAARPSAWSGP